MTDSDCLGWVQLDMDYDQHDQEFILPDSRQLDDSSEASGGCCLKSRYSKISQAFMARTQQSMSWTVLAGCMPGETLTETLFQMLLPSAVNHIVITRSDPTATTTQHRTDS